MRAKIVRGDYDMPEVLFRHLPSEAKDFISRLLVTDPKKRMSADQALVHPWLRCSTARSVCTHEYAKYYSFLSVFFFTTARASIDCDSHRIDTARKVACVSWHNSRKGSRRADGGLDLKGDKNTKHEPPEWVGGGEASCSVTLGMRWLIPWLKGLEKKRRW